jgi:hypothetical protein
MTLPLGRSPARRSLGTIFLVPMIVALTSCAGLLSALLGDGLWDGLSWLALSVPVVVALWFALRRQNTFRR